MLDPVRLGCIMGKVTELAPTRRLLDRAMMVMVEVIRQVADDLRAVRISALIAFPCPPAYQITLLTKRGAVGS